MSARRVPGPPVWRDFPPHAMQDYALVADGHRGALVGPRGDVAFLCAPTWDSAGVVSALVGGGGTFAVTPVEPFVWGGSYEEGSLVWTSRWRTTSCTIECHEALAYPADPHRLVMLRQVEAHAHPAVVRVVLDLRGDWGSKRMRQLRRRADGCWTARTGDLWFRLAGAPDAHVDDDGRLVLELRVPPGARHDLVLEVSDEPLPEQLPHPHEVWQATREAWDEAVPAMTSTVAPRDARASYALLRGLTAPGGGMVAAPTLGLPERAHGGKNYDYRYVWLRDQAYAGLACAAREPLPLLDDAVAFTVARVMEDGDDLSPGYRVDGTSIPEQETLGLSGYPGGQDVVGNWVTGQFQLDTAGDVLALLAAAARHDRLDAVGERALLKAVRIVETRWQEPDAGIWELDDDWWTHSRLTCVAGLRAAAAVLPRAQAGPVASLADAVLAETDRRCLGADGRWVRSPNHDGVDASLVLPPVRGALPAADPRTRATLDAVDQQLVQDGFVYRFRPDARPLGEAEGAFLLCGFQMALARWHQGEVVDAFRWFERTKGVGGTSGLLSEEYDVDERQLRGNFPQAFVHAMLLEAAQCLGDAPGQPS